MHTRKAQIAISIILTAAVVAMLSVAAFLIDPFSTPVNGPVTTRSSSATFTSIASVSSSNPTRQIFKGQILLNSSRPEVVSSKSWDIELTKLPTTQVQSTKYEGDIDLNHIILTDALFRLEIHGTVLDFNPREFDQPRSGVLTNGQLSTQEISRVKDLELFEYTYVTGYREGAVCRPAEGATANYCSQGGIIDKLIKVSCYADSPRGLSQCDDIVKSMSVEYKVLN